MNKVLQTHAPAPFSLRRLVAACLQTTTLLGSVAIVAGHLVLLVLFDHQRQQVLTQAAVQAANLNMVFEQHVMGALRTIDQMLLSAREAYARDPSSFSVEAVSRTEHFPKNLVLQLALVDADGRMTGSSLASTGAVDVSDRELFRVHRDTPRDEVLISQPVPGGTSQAWTIQFTRRLLDPQGRFAGVLVASMDTTYLSRISESIDIGSSGAVVLFGLDGIIRARGGASSLLPGQALGGPIMDRARAAETGVDTGPDLGDGLAQIVSFRRVPGAPLVVAVALGRKEVLAPFERSRETIQQITWLVDLAILVLMGIGIFESYRLRAMRQHVSATSQMLASTFALMHEGILLIDGEGRLVAMNELARHVLGLADGGFVPLMPYAQLPLAHREAGAGPQAIQHISLADGRTIEVKTSELPDGGLVKTLNDVTARIQARVALEDARDKAESATHARTAFLATMSHEIRTPLGGIISIVDLIAGTKLDPVQKRYAEITRDSATHLLQLIDDVLDVTKLDANHIDLEDIPFDLYRQIRNTLDIVSPRALAKGLSVGSVVAPDVPRDLLGDPGRLRQVLINLLGNAIKFTATGHVLLEVTRASDDTGERLCMRVADTGIGIAPGDLKNLFTDFSQVDSTIARRFGGTGLGLSISRKLVTCMGGTIGVESRPGVGSVFHFEIPLRAVRAALPVVEGPAHLGLVMRDAFTRANVQRQFEGVFARVACFETFADARAWAAQDANGSPRRIVLVDAALAPQGGVAEMAETRHAECVLLLACHEAHALEPATNGYRGALYRPIFPDDLRACLDTPPPPLQVVADGAHPGRQDQMTGLRVLVAEDNATNQFALTRMLEGMGATVVSALNGREALAQVEAQAFDVILMDVMMPEMDGLAATRAIRASFGPDASIPIIALTASAFVEDREAAYAAGVSAFLTKPITSQMLLDIIEACRAGVPGQTMSGHSMSGQVMPVQALPTKDDDAGPALDRPLIEQLREDLGPEHMRAALDLFLSDLAKRGASLRLCDRSAITLRKEAHALKGSAASFGFRHIAQAAARLEDAARENEVEKFDILVARLLEAAARAPILLAA